MISPSCSKMWMLLLALFMSSSHIEFGLPKNARRKNLKLSVRPRSSSTQTKLSEHEANRGEAEKSECVSVEVFEILGQPAAAIEPSESALDNPTSRQKRKPFGLVGAFDDFDLDVWQDFG